MYQENNQKSIRVIEQKLTMVISHSASCRQDNKGLYNTLSPTDKTAEFENSVDLDEVAHHEPPHQDLHYLPSSF